VKKWSDFNGYGFNLHAEKGKAGQFIGKVDSGSPAEAAGLKDGDRIIEVNGTNIGNENHGQVVQRIKAVPNETKLLVVDPETDAYFKEKKIVVRGDMPYVETIECPNEKGGEVIRSSPSSPESNSQDEPVEQQKENAAPEPDADSKAAAAAASAEDGPSPRQCHLKIWPDFQGYGFNLHAEKGKPGQFIGKVDAGSPAEAAGLKQGDRIVEVNGQYIGEDNHGQVVQKIKSDPMQTTMLVVDEEAENYYRQKGIRVNSSMSNVKNIYCQASKEEYTAKANAADASPAPVSSAAEADPAPRLCHLKIWSDFKGYGFNLHAEKERGKGQYVGKVDAGSPAEAAGLREGDKIIEVNGRNMAKEDHRNVVSEIKADSTQVRLLVVDSAGYTYYTSRDITITGGMSNVETIVCPDSKGGLANGTSAAVEQAETKAEVNHSEVNGAPSSDAQEPVKQEEVTPNVDVNENEPVKSAEPEANGLSEGDEVAAAIEDSIREAEEEVNMNEKKQEEQKKQEEEKKKEEELQRQNEELDALQDYEVVERLEPESKTKPATVVAEPEDKSKEASTPTTYENSDVAVSKPAEPVYTEPEPQKAPSSPTTPSSPIDGMFAGSAKEARERLRKGSSRKHEVKKQEVSMRDKYDLFQKL